jgi:hypothetical protein
MRVAGAGLVQAKWTDEILGEVFSSILRQRPDLDASRLARTRELMRTAVPDCLVEGYQGLADNVDLPDPGDRHVLAAAVRCGAQSIVTNNLKDFPRGSLEPLGIEAIHPDRFILDLLELREGVVLQCLHEQCAALRHPPVTLPDLVFRLETCGLVQAMAEVRMLLGSNV